MATVEAIFDGTIQVLLALGMEKLTTTKVAERAGVSVGTLYQYFPNKESLLFAVLNRHLTQVVLAVELACEQARDKTTEIMAATLVQSLLAAKFKDPLASRALYAVTADTISKELITKMTQRSQLAICDMLMTSSNHEFPDLLVSGFLLATSLVGPIQALLEADKIDESLPTLEQHLISMTAGYLTTVGIRKNCVPLRSV